MKRRSLGLVLAVFLIAPVFGVTMSSCASPKQSAKTDTEAVDEAARKAAEEEAARLAREEAERQRLQQEAEEAARLAEMKQAQEAERARFLTEMANFDFDKYNIRSDAEEILRHKAEFMEANASLTTEIQGHCDERGSEAYNMALGDRRANSAKSFLEALGVAPERMTMVSYGEENPLNPEHNEAAWAENRRAQFMILSE